MTPTLDTVLLLGLPAAGKSEVRRYLGSLAPAVRAAEFHLGPTVQLVDSSCLALMRRADDELRAAGGSPAFFLAPDRTFQDPRDWGTLVHLLNDDHLDVRSRRVVKPGSAAEHLLGRIDAARRRVGAPPVLPGMPAAVRGRVVDALEKEARALLDAKHAAYPDTLAGKTVVLELARGGAHGASLPLAEPHGYAYALRQLSPELLERATLLYVWVTPEEARRRNAASPHGHPLDVMMSDFGCDDFSHLLETSGRPGKVRLEAHGRTHFLPAVRFDNRADRTSFVHDDPASWKKPDVEALHAGLKASLQDLYRLAQR